MRTLLAATAALAMCCCGSSEDAIYCPADAQSIKEYQFETVEFTSGDGQEPCALTASFEADSWRVYDEEYEYEYTVSTTATDGTCVMVGRLHTDASPDSYELDISRTVTLSHSGCRLFGKVNYWLPNENGEMSDHYCHVAGTCRVVAAPDRP